MDQKTICVVMSSRAGICKLMRLSLCKPVIYSTDFPVRHLATENKSDKYSVIQLYHIGIFGSVNEFNIDFQKKCSHISVSYKRECFFTFAAIYFFVQLQNC